MKRLLLLLLVGAVHVRAASAPDPFRAGNEQYGRGDFRAAIASYEEQVRTGEWSANLFYNLGNAYYRTDNLGRAILSYERALALLPGHPEAKANLQLARDQAQALEPALPPWQATMGGLSERNYAILAAVLFWAALLLLLWRSRGVLVALSALLFLGALVSAGALAVLQKQSAGRAVITGEKVEARVATADSAKGILALPAGSIVQILQQRGDWDYAVLPNGERGWIAANTAESIRL